jgi:hypothetical protein
VGAAILASLALIAVAVAVALSRAPPVVAGTNSVASATVVGATKGPASACQGNEVIPAGTTAVRLWLQGNVKPRVRVSVIADSRRVASGTEEGGWLGKVTTVPITRVPDTIRDAQVCFSIDRAVQIVNLLGGPTRHPAPGEAPDKMRIEYLRPGSVSWWSLAGSVARRMGFGRAPAGGWVALVPLALMALAALLALGTAWVQLGRGGRPSVPPIAGAQAPSPQAAHPRTDLPRAAVGADPARGRPSLRGGRPGRLRAGLRRVPGPAWACACVAFLSAASWSIVTPPFQAPDEPAHFAYAQILAETGALPKLGASAYSTEEMTALADLNQRTVRFNQAIGTISTEAQERRLQDDLAAHMARTGLGAGVATSEPPLYYALETLPYGLGSGGTLLERLELMRLLSALLAGLTGLFVFLFLREALPAVPWAWTVGGLCAALAPLLGFISGVVNPDAMLCAASAVLFYCMARGFRRGLTLGLAIAIGAVTAIGLMTKLNFIGLTPGVLLALWLLARRAARTSGSSAYRSLAAAVAIGLGPGCVYVAINALSNHAALGALSSGLSGTGTHQGSPLRELSYIWQFYLPRLPGMTDYFPGISTIRQVWFDKLVGDYGWLDTNFPGWVYDFALIPAGLIAALCARELLRGRVELRARAQELIAYGAMGAGLLILFGADSYLESSLYTGAFSEARYLLPLAALFAAAFALAARGAGRRWGPAVGALLVTLILAHDVFSQLQTVSRYFA